MAFERDLCRALGGRAPGARWMGPSDPAAFVAAVEDLVEALAAGQGRRPREHAINAFDTPAFPLPGRFNPDFDLRHWACCVSPARRRGFLAAVVSVLLEGESGALLSEHRI